jgi:branched-chain amino acid transport system substrate-binding protein
MPVRSIRTLLSLALIAVLCTAVLIPAGCAPKLPPEPLWERDARVLLDQADGFYLKKQYDQAAKTVDSFFKQYPKSRHADRALRLMGEMRLLQRDYAQALSYYREIIQKYPSSPFIIDAKYKLGLCYFELKEYDLAISDLEDRSGIKDPLQLRRISEMLSAAYLAKNRYLPAIKELAFLLDANQNEQQKAGYRDRIREIIDKNLTVDELTSLTAGVAYPADIAQLRLAGLLLEQRNYRDAIKISKVFLEKFPNHPEKTRAEMLLNDATAKLTAPRYHIAALVPQSGQLAFFGDRVLKGIQLAVYEYNQQHPDDRVELLVKDTEGSPEKAIAALTDLAAKDVVAAIGPLLTKEAEALAPVLATLKIPVITPAASGEGIGKLSPWMFRNALTNSAQAAAAAQLAVSLKLKKFVIFYPDDGYGKDLTRLFTHELENKAEILATIAYPSDVKDFGPYVRRAMEIDLRSRKIQLPEDDAERKKLLQEYTPSFDALYLPGYAERVGLLIPQLAYYNITGMTTIGSNNWHTADLIDRAQRHANGAIFVDGYFPESTDPVIKPIMDAYRSAYQEEPDILAAQAYDATAMVLSLIKDHKDTPQAIRDGLLTLKDYPGITGTISFNGDGEARKKLFLITVQDGRFVPFVGANEH